MLLYRARIKYIAVLNAVVEKPSVIHRLMHPGAICIFYKDIGSGVCMLASPSKQSHTATANPQSQNTGSSSKLVLVLLQEAGVEVGQVLCNVLDVLLAGQDGRPARNTCGECAITCHAA